MREVKAEELPELHQRMFTASLGTATDALLRDGEMTPHAVLMVEDGVIYLPAISFGSNEDKDFFAAAVKATATAKQATAVCYVSEAWAFVPRGDTPEQRKSSYNDFMRWRSANSDAQFNEYTGEGVENRVMINTESYDGTSVSNLTIKTASGKQYLDPRDEAKHLFIEYEERGNDGFKGRFFGLLPPRSAIGNVRAIALAQALLDHLGSVEISSERMDEIAKSGEAPSKPDLRDLQ